MRLGCLGLDDDRAVHPGLFLQAGMAVVPVGAALLQGELVEVVATGLDAGKAQARHAVHVGRQDDAVPMQRGRLVQAIAHAQGHCVAFAPSQHRAWQAVVDGQCSARSAGDVDRRLANEQVEVAAGEFIAQRGAGGKGGQAPEAKAGQGAGGGEAFDEGTAGGMSEHVIANPVAMVARQ
ncbi:hypothetical protein D3C77_521920 [compost metagenome]